MALYTEYIPVKKSPTNDIHIKFQITFNKDTYHWATSSSKKKGYQLTATPVKRTLSSCGKYNTESFTAFQGFYIILVQYDRQSKKRLEEAINSFKAKKDDYLQFFIKKGIEISDEHFLNKPTINTISNEN